MRFDGGRGGREERGDCGGGLVEGSSVGEWVEANHGHFLAVDTEAEDGVYGAEEGLAKLPVDAITDILSSSWPCEAEL